MPTIRPLGDRVLVRILPEEEKVAGLLYVDINKFYRFRRAEVMAVGPRVPPDVGVGMRVVLPKEHGQYGNEREVGRFLQDNSGERQLLLQWFDLLGVLEDDTAPSRTTGVF